MVSDLIFQKRCSHYRAGDAVGSEIQVEIVIVYEKKIITIHQRFVKAQHPQRGIY